MQSSKVLKEDHDALVALCKRMKPEERLTAFYNHNRMISRLYQAGVDYRSRRPPKPGPDAKHQ